MVTMITWFPIWTRRKWKQREHCQYIWKSLMMPWQSSELVVKVCTVVVVIVLSILMMVYSCCCFSFVHCLRSNSSSSLLVFVVQVLATTANCTVLNHDGQLTLVLPVQNHWHSVKSNYQEVFQSSQPIAESVPDLLLCPSRSTVILPLLLLFAKLLLLTTLSNLVLNSTKFGNLVLNKTIIIFSITIAVLNKTKAFSITIAVLKFVLSQY